MQICSCADFSDTAGADGISEEIADVTNDVLDASRLPTSDRFERLQQQRGDCVTRRQCVSAGCYPSLN